MGLYNKIKLPDVWGENMTLVSLGMRISARRSTKGSVGTAQFPLPRLQLPVLFQGDKER